MKVSIIIRSKNEERFIGAVLQRILAQEFPDPYEVIVLDSGSQDRTVEIVHGFPVRLEEIPTGKFTYGFALNHGASLAHGEYVVFLSAHCVPCERSWLRELTEPLAKDVRIVATYGRQEPMPGVNPFEEIELERAYTLRADNTVRAPLSNANSAVRKSVWQLHPFDEQVTFSEDFLWAYTLPAPYLVHYVHSASVFHSHPLLFRYWRRRWYEEGMMVQYLAQRCGVPDPWAEDPTQRRSFLKWHAFKRMGKDLRGLWQRRELRALCRYPFYMLNRVYFYKKGQRDGVRLFMPSRGLADKDYWTLER